MGSTELNPIDLMVAVIRDHSPESIWTGSPLEGYRHVGNTNRGEIGEEFVERYLGHAGVPVERGSRVTGTDLRILGVLKEDRGAGSIAGLVAGDAGEFDRRMIGKPGDEREAAAHRLHRPAQRGQQHVAALLQP